MTENAAKNGQKKNRLPALLGMVVVGMFAFGFALVPLYSLVCSVAGINSISSNSGRISEADLTDRVDRSRLLNVEFDATIHAGLSWEFRPLVKKMQVHPGQVYEVAYYARNNSDATIVGQAIPGVTPWQATEHFNKTECFCFTQQTLKPGEAKEMPLRFVISPHLPKRFGTVTLSYTFMDTNPEKARQMIGKAGETPAIAASQ